jgi:threonine/homoserine/homoserine lactone efflux protein
MSASVKLVGWAIAISFVGSLPFGTLNLSVVNYVSHHDQRGALYFSLAATAVEMIIVWYVLIALGKMEKLKRFYKLFSLLACMVLLAIAVNTLATTTSMQSGAINLPVVDFHPLVAGLLVSIANPLHLPFWLGWTAVLRSRSILNDRRSSHYTFVVSIGIGTALAFMLYGIAGHYATDVLGRYQHWLNWAMGITLLVMALVQVYKTFFRSKKALPEASGHPA